MSLIAAHAKVLIEAVKPLDNIKDAELGELSKPLLDCLLAEKHINVQQRESAFAEAQGIWEFGVVSIHVQRMGNFGTWLTVHPDGRVEGFSPVIEPCCKNERRSMQGGCLNCGDPCL